MSHKRSATFGDIIPLSIGKIYVSTSTTGLSKLQLQSLKQIPNRTAQMLVRLRKCILGNLILRIQLQLLCQIFIQPHSIYQAHIIVQIYIPAQALYNRNITK